DKSEINIDHMYQYVSIAAPYLELIEEYTLKELFHFHHQFKPFMKGSSFKEMAAEVQLKNAFNKEIRYYSSGMKQRAKLAQAFFSDTPILLLDEPCTNLDKEGVQLYQRLLSEQVKTRLIIISSNSPEEYIDSDEQIHITDYK
ncbi:MAG TPA: ATP-binding cassette domain-containing protein, partial [Chitinophagaceae bacterium]|nr:ATP-binding cassette domain-containing protein [Chitinophagaceae bacterium]